MRPTSTVTIPCKWILLRSITFWLTVLPAAIKDVLISGYNIQIIAYQKGFDSLLLCLRYASCFRYDQLLNLVAVDFPGKVLRFFFSYGLLTNTFNSRVWVSLFPSEKKPLPSATPLFSSSIWLEREVYDLMGLFFANHPDLRRILTDYGFCGAPLRKDFPLFGFTELSFNNRNTQVRLLRQQEDQGIRFQPQEKKWLPL